MRSYAGIAAYFCLLGCLVSSGCATEPAVMNGAHEVAQRHAHQAIESARAEVTGMRSEVAATRIAAAKKEAELLDLRRENGDLRQMVEVKQMELATLSGERDHLVQVKNEFRVQLDELPQLRQKTAEATAREEAFRTRLREVESALSDLTRDVQTRMALLPNVDRTVAEAKALEVTIQTRMKELESGVSTLFTEWHEMKTDWVKYKTQLRPAEPEVVKKEPEIVKKDSEQAVFSPPPRYKSSR
jgi:chromosome segregation ATPase